MIFLTYLNPASLLASLLGTAKAFFFRILIPPIRLCFSAGLPPVPALPTRFPGPLLLAFVTFVSFPTLARWSKLRQDEKKVLSQQRLHCEQADRGQAKVRGCDHWGQAAQGVVMATQHIQERDPVAITLPYKADSCYETLKATAGAICHSAMHAQGTFAPQPSCSLDAELS